MNEFGCSSFTWETEDGKHLMGRTYDQFGNLDGNRIILVPEKSRLRLGIDPSSPYDTETRLGFAGMAVLGLDTPVMVDGINEAGLMGALLNFPKYADYKAQKDGWELLVHPGFFVTHLLGACGSVEEVVQESKRIRLSEETIFGQRMSVHYLFSDASGETVVIEPGREGLTVYRNTIGVLTNSPEYPWHLTNLSNYADVTNLPKEPRSVCGREVAVFGEKQGGGMGLPGDYTSPSRFVRMAFFKQFAVKGENETDGVSRMFHNFATVDIPEGIIRAGADSGDYEMTLCTSVMCAESRTYYFTTAKNRRISAIRLDRELLDGGARCFGLAETEDIHFLK